MIPSTRTLTRCLVCGFAEVRTDEVVDRGLVLLSECPRCEDRRSWRVPVYETTPAIWPERPAPLRAVAAAARLEESQAA